MKKPNKLELNLYRCGHCAQEEALAAAGTWAPHVQRTYWWRGYAHGLMHGGIVISVWLLGSAIDLSK